MRTSLSVVTGPSVDGRVTGTVEVLVDLDRRDTVADLTRALAIATGTAAAGLWQSASLLDPGASVAASGLSFGSRVCLTGPAAPAAVQDPTGPGPGAPVVVAVVSGPDAGLVLPLALGDATLGPDQLPLAGLDRAAARLSVGAAGVVVTDLGSARTTRLGGAPLTAPTAWGVQDLLEVGADLLAVRPGRREAAATAPGDDLRRVVTRPPRLTSPLPPLSVSRPEAPAAHEARRLPVLPLVLPLLLGVAMALLLNPLFLLFTLMSPLLAVGSWWSDRRSGRSGYDRALAAHAHALTAAQEQVDLRCTEETSHRRDQAPDAATLLLTATGPGPRLWERRPADVDRLLLRIGTHDLPATSLRVSVGTTPVDPPLLRDVPVVLDLAATGVAGLTGPQDEVRALARWLVGQAAVLHAPGDLQVWLLAHPGAADAPDTQSAWSWVRWLPHCQAPEGPAARVGLGVDDLADRVADLTSLVSARRAAHATDVRTALATRGQPDLLVVLDGARSLRELPGVPVLLRDGPAVGVHVLCLDREERLLPEECRAVLSLDGAGRLDVRRAAEPGHEQVRADLVSPAWCEQVARGLAGLRTGGDGAEAALPSTARLLDVLDLTPTPEQVLARWGRTPTAVIGVSQDGPFALDLRRDGPHVLVAGTTGAGKSELLQTLVASLALGNRPDAMTFVLVDYKGGAAFKDCARLPHTVGMVTDLDGPLVERALASLTAELTLRERMLAEAGTKDLEDYWYDGSPTGPLARLVLVIDEFASLVEELPDFVRGLVGIAQRGRSLGVHLVLATQRPSGVVSPEIRANTNLRIALRVTDAAESHDVVDSADAAALPRALPGRAVVRTGPSSLVTVQTARIGGRAPGATGTRPPIVVTPLPWSCVGAPAPALPAPAEEPEQESTDLYAVVEALRAASDALGGPSPRRPWLDPLPEHVLVPTPPGPTPPGPTPPGPTVPSRGEGNRRPRLTPVAYGVEDVPSRQARAAAVLDLEHGGHLLVVGAARSGRTTLLRTLAGSLARSVPASDAHLYVLDCGNGGLVDLAALPHCGAVVTRAQPERADRLLARLLEELTRRQDLLATRGLSDVAAQRQVSADPLPYLVLLVDRWEGFTAAFDEVDAGRLTDVLLRLLRDGPGVGLRVVVTGDRSALAGRLTSTIEDVLVLSLADRTDYALAGLAPTQVPAHLPAGRGVRPATGTQVQVALLDGPGADAADQVAALAAVAAECTGPVGRRPFRVDVLPARVTWAQARDLPGTGPGIALAVGGDDLTLQRVDLAVHGPGFTVVGPPRSGRSTALLGMARELLGAGTPVCVLAPRPSPLRDLAGAPGVRAVLTEASPEPRVLAEVLQGAHGPLVVLVDDAELLEQAPVGDLLQQVLREGRDRGHALVAAGTTEELAGSFRGATVDARRSRSGLLLSPASPLDGELLGVRLSRSATFSGPVGRGLLVRSGQVLLVQVPV